MKMESMKKSIVVRIIMSRVRRDAESGCGGASSGVEEGEDIIQSDA
jgi:hypothetical protein